MNAHVLLDYQTSWGKEIKYEACRAFYCLFATSLINLIIQDNECYIIFIIMTVKLL